MFPTSSPKISKWHWHVIGTRKEKWCAVTSPDCLGNAINADQISSLSHFIILDWWETGAASQNNKDASREKSRTGDGRTRARTATEIGTDEGSG